MGRYSEIDRENRILLKKMSEIMRQQAQPVYNHIEWEGSSKRNNTYLKNCAEYPLVLRSARGANRSSELVALDLDGRPKEEVLTARSEKSGMKGAADLGDEG